MTRTSGTAWCLVPHSNPDTMIVPAKSMRSLGFFTLGPEQKILSAAQHSDEKKQNSKVLEHA